jgi:outer membrane protein OmpA-like peptidoglycan-associated protein
MFQQLRINFTLLKIFAATLLLLLLQNANAQSKFGIIAGAGKTSLYKFPFSPDDFNRYSSTTSLWAGVTADLPIKKNKLSLFIAPTYIQKGYDYLYKKETGVGNAIKDSGFEQKINYVDVNLNLRKKFVFGKNNSFFAGTGPVISFLTGGKEKIQASYFGNILPAINKTNTSLSDSSSGGKYKSSFLSWNVSAGFEIKNFSVGLTINIPIDNYFTDKQVAVNHTIKTIGINLGYKLFTTRRKNKIAKVKDTTLNVPVAIDTLADTDGDGITDVNDKCPGHKGTAKYFGCPIPDTDGDGINDEEDKCIDAAGTIANNGCPDFADTVKTTAADSTCYTVYFEPAKSILRTEAYKTLDKIIKQLKANPKLMAVFKGHTDNSGNEAANNRVSFARASVCASYVASYYIDKKRLFMLALGKSMPAADLNDPLLQWKNRRVEICVVEKKE